MRLDQLQLDLRPRTNAQALDLGFALLRANAGRVYAVWLSLWIPAMLVSALIANWLFDRFEYQVTYAFLVAWWIRPWLERAPLYILSRQVFGEQVGFWETLRAWPKQLGGGFFRLFVLRPFAAGRGLYQAIWLLEGARGKTARYRIRIIGRHTISSATWFGVACAHFEVIIQLGLYGLVGLFVSDKELMNPIALMMNSDPKSLELMRICGLLSYTIAVSILGPIYTACCFTLYLNRRATLEAWDLEIALRQIAALHDKADPNTTAPKSHSIGSVLALACIGITMSLSLSLPTEVRAEQADSASASASAAATTEPEFQIPSCKDGKLENSSKPTRAPTEDTEIAKTRQTIDDIYASEDFNLFRCEQRWLPKFDKKEKPTFEEKEWGERMKMIALVLKYLVIGAGLAFLGWLLFRYSGKIFLFESEKRLQLATEIAGLDIRPESLPEDVAQSALDMWQLGQKRAAIGLLYRASIAHLVQHHELHITKGATEQDCLRLSSELLDQNAMFKAKLSCFEDCTDTWLRAAYAHQYPPSIHNLCEQWRQHFASEVQA
ncbi:hypothetical protein RF679_01445 [Undibacterium cyanobacteriorum]|uniref:DUF4129 domain-containing protein n=1 Tax=Undibacterium cyanobacteriorum TaxID=3073561 RepID=A0ABY9RIB6_9BURK|nr:hypothetical protein [Undibacterium sp. 20NA77.5]WMW80961.1 hypothetical protein RF679_01445 [Undibacterium sp. 20NA77.5]